MKERGRGGDRVRGAVLLIRWVAWDVSEYEECKGADEEQDSLTRHE
jgi:hypothetical protein